MSELEQETAVEDTAPPAESQEPADPPVNDEGGDKTGTIAAGAVSEKPDEPAKEPAKEPETDWREEWADRYANGDEKAAKRHMKTLKRFDKPEDVFGSYNELRAYISEGGLVKIPGEDATDEERAAYRKAVGVPENPSDYLDSLKLDNDAVLGDDDKPIVENFVGIMHEAGATPEQVNGAVNWYFKTIEDQAAQMAEADDRFKVESQSALKEEMGGAFKRNTNVIPTVFANAAGGFDLENEHSVAAKLLGGRTADGHLIGDDPDVIRWLVNLGKEINPAVSVMEGGDGTGKTIDAEIADIEKLMRTDRNAYNKDEALQARYLELLDAQEKVRSRA